MAEQTTTAEALELDLQAFFRWHNRQLARNGYPPTGQEIFLFGLRTGIVRGRSQEHARHRAIMHRR